MHPYKSANGYNYINLTNYIEAFIYTYLKGAKGSYFLFSLNVCNPLKYKYIKIYIQKRLKKLVEIFAYIKKAFYLCRRVQGKGLNEQQIFIHLLNFFIMEQVGKIYDYLIDNELFSDGELSLLCCINGYSVKTLNDAIYARYGYSDFDALLDDLA